MYNFNKEYTRIVYVNWFNVNPPRVNAIQQNGCACPDQVRRGPAVSLVCGQEQQQREQKGKFDSNATVIYIYISETLLLGAAEQGL